MTTKSEKRKIKREQFKNQEPKQVCLKSYGTIREVAGIIGKPIREIVDALIRAECIKDQAEGKGRGPTKKGFEIGVAKRVWRVADKDNGTIVQYPKKPKKSRCTGNESPNLERVCDLV